MMNSMPDRHSVFIHPFHLLPRRLPEQNTSTSYPIKANRPHRYNNQSKFIKIPNGVPTQFNANCQSNLSCHKKDFQFHDHRRPGPKRNNEMVLGTYTGYNTKKNAQSVFKSRQYDVSKQYAVSLEPMVQNVQETNKNNNRGEIVATESSLSNLTQNIIPAQNEDLVNTCKANIPSVIIATGTQTEVKSNLNAVAEAPEVNTKEKTPMCLVNDLARFNKIPFQYRLTGEKGPAHCKIFTVTLKLGDEEYTAEGFKIKAAQHVAAKEAITKTKYKHPTPKVNRRHDDDLNVRSNVTPTVELNALAMKMGQPTYYVFDSAQQANPLPAPETLLQRYKVTQVVGSSIHRNTTRIVQQHTHLQDTVNCHHVLAGSHVQNASRSKLSNIYSMLMSQQQTSFTIAITLIVGNQKFVGVGKSIQQAKHNAAAQAVSKLKEQMTFQALASPKENEDVEHKSPISQVFEIGIKRNLSVDFKILHANGPAHMRTFTTICTVGNIVTEGQGSGKKSSKKLAAQKMIAELEKLPPLEPVGTPAKLVKPQKTSTTKPKYTKDADALKISRPNFDNPISRVIDWCQSRNKEEPVFTILKDDGKDRSREKFVIEVCSNDVSARGVGSSKKIAKRNAAQNFLAVVNSESANKSASKKKDEIETTCEAETGCTSASKSTVANEQVPSTNNETTKPTRSKGNFFMKDKLLYLARLLGVEVDYSDYPKGSHNEFLTILMISTNPPQICHGVGANSEESQEEASKSALNILSQMGLNGTQN